MNIKKLSWKFIFLKVPWTFIALVWILTILLLCSHTNGFSETLENVPKFHSIQMNAKRWFYFSLFGKLHWQARCSSKLSYFSSVQETIVLTVGWVSQGAWLAGVGELRPEWLLVTVVQLGMRVLPKHHLHETLGCTQPTFCSTDASSWWRRPCPTGWATRSCWWPALGPGCTGGHWSWVHSTSHYWAIISPPVGYTGCLLTLAGGQVGPPLSSPLTASPAGWCLLRPPPPRPDRWWKEPWLTAEREAKSLWRRAPAREAEAILRKQEQREARSGRQTPMGGGERPRVERVGRPVSRWRLAGGTLKHPAWYHHTPASCFWPRMIYLICPPLSPLHCTYIASYNWRCHSERRLFSSKLNQREREIALRWGAEWPA